VGEAPIRGLEIHPVRYGRECGVPVPVTETMYGTLLPYELQAQGKLESPPSAGN
jgi:hypothetical protein